MLGIIDYKAGNLTSVKRALDYLGIASVISSDPGEIAACERIIFPGVGNAASAMETLRRRGLDTALRNAFARGTPVLGICLGAQIILSHSEEGDTPCIGLIEGVCRKFTPGDRTLKVPHMGWNEISIVREHPVLKGTPKNTQVYFVHSFFPLPSEETAVFATCEYGIVFPCAIGHKNLFATQFHLEKSAGAGLMMLKNFSTWEGAVC